MTYKINGVEMTLQPTTGRWVPKQLVGITGDGHHVYPSIREFEMRWQLGSPSDVDQLVTWFETQVLTGTLVVTLPQWHRSSYTFYDYTGCTMSEPEFDVYFNENITNVALVIRNITT